MDQDAAWKRLFGLPIVVRHLLQGFVGEVAKLLDLGSLRKLSASWVGADAEQRHGDAAWRVSYADGSGRSLVLLLEFQSTVDRDMARRVLRYQGMAFEALLRQDELDPDGELRLLSVVVYSGTARWTAPGAALGMTVSHDGEILCPRPYLLLDTARAAQHDLWADNIVAAAFRLDNAASADHALELAWSLAEWLSTGLEATDRDTGLEALIEWLSILQPREADGRTQGSLAGLRDLMLNREAGMTRLAERAREWQAEWFRKGAEQGIEQGVERGVAPRGRRRADPAAAAGVAQVRRRRRPTAGLAAGGHRRHGTPRDRRGVDHRQRDVRGTGGAARRRRR